MTKAKAKTQNQYNHAERFPWPYVIHYEQEQTNKQEHPNTVILISSQEIACLRTKVWYVLVPFKLFSLTL